MEEYWGNVNCTGVRSCYDEGKRAAETLFFDYHRQNNVDIRVARIFNTYGPGMHPYDGRVTSNFLVQAINNEDITCYGDGSQTRSFCYVDDLIDGLIRLMNQEETIGPVNIGNPGEFTIKQLAELAIKTTGSKSKIIYQPLPGDDPKQRKPDITKARKYLGWEPKIPLEVRPCVWARAWCMVRGAWWCMVHGHGQVVTQWEAWRTCARACAGGLRTILGSSMRTRGHASERCVSPRCACTAPSMPF